MAGRFHGPVGFAITENDGFGVSVERIVERNYTGYIPDAISLDILDTENLNPDLGLGNLISIVADGFAHEHFPAIRFVEWSGTVWTVTNVQNRRPRLVLRLGGVYNGRRAADFA